MKIISNKTIVTIGSIMLIILGVFHITFWNLFDWGNELPKLNPDNNSLVQMMNICTICYLLSMGFILISCRSEIADSKVGRLLLLSLALFFTVRLILEFVFPNSSLILGCILLLCVVVFAVPALKKK